MEVVPVPQLSDNYAYLLIDPATREAAVVDCAEGGLVLAEVDRRQVRLVAVLATHHHFDHIGGNEDLLAGVPGLRERLFRVERSGTAAAPGAFAESERAAVPVED